MNATAPNIFPLADVLVSDNHCCVPLRPLDESFLPQLWRYKESGIDVACIKVGCDAMPWENTVQMAAQFRHWSRRHSERYVQMEAVADVHRARLSGQYAVEEHRRDCNRNQVTDQKTPEFEKQAVTGANLLHRSSPR